MDKLNEEVVRPWGSYFNIGGGDNNGYKVKRLVVNVGKRLSLQNHQKRSEHWILIKGSAKIRIGNDYHILNKNQSIYVPCGVLHRVENICDENVEIIEVQVGSYLGEDDIQRYEDDFGRT